LPDYFYKCIALGEISGRLLFMIAHIAEYVLLSL